MSWEQDICGWMVEPEPEPEAKAPEPVAPAVGTKDEKKSIPLAGYSSSALGVTQQSFLMLAETAVESKSTKTKMPLACGGCFEEAARAFGGN